jgi:hypothetical protein
MVSKNGHAKSAGEIILTKKTAVLGEKYYPSGTLSTTKPTRTDPWVI